MQRPAWVGLGSSASHHDTPLFGSGEFSGIVVFSFILIPGRILDAVHELIDVSVFVKLFLLKRKTF